MSNRSSRHGRSRNCGRSICGADDVGAGGGCTRTWDGWSSALVATVTKTALRRAVIQGAVCLVERRYGIVTSLLTAHQSYKNVQALEGRFEGSLVTPPYSK